MFTLAIYTPNICLPWPWRSKGKENPFAVPSPMLGGWRGTWYTISFDFTQPGSDAGLQRGNRIVQWVSPALAPPWLPQGALKGRLKEQRALCEIRQRHCSPGSLDEPCVLKQLELSISFLSWKPLLSATASKQAFSLFSNALQKHLLASFCPAWVWGVAMIRASWYI